MEPPLVMLQVLNYCKWSTKRRTNIDIAIENCRSGHDLLLINSYVGLPVVTKEYWMRTYLYNRIIEPNIFFTVQTVSHCFDKCAATTDRELLGKCDGETMMTTSAGTNELNGSVEQWQLLFGHFPGGLACSYHVRLI